MTKSTIYFLLALILLFLSSCNLLNKSKADELFSDAIQKLENHNYNDAEKDFLKYLDITNENINDSTAFAKIGLAGVYFQYDSIEAWNKYLKEAQEYYFFRGRIAELNKLEIKEAEFLSRDLDYSSTNKVLDKISDKNLLNKISTKVEIAIIKDDCFFNEFGYYTDSLLSEVENLIPEISDKSLILRFKLQNIKHNTFRWKFKKANDELSEVDSLLDIREDIELHFEKDFTRAEYHHEMFEHIKADSLLGLIKLNYDSLISPRRKFRLDYLSAASYLQQHHFLNADSVLIILKEEFYDKVNIHKQFLIDQMYMEYLTSTGSYELLQEEIDSCLLRYPLESYPLKYGKTKLIEGNLMIKEKNHFGAEGVLNSLVTKLSDIYYYRLMFNVLLKRIENFTNERKHYLAHELLNNIEPLRLYKREYYYFMINKGRTQYFLNHKDNALNIFNDILRFTKRLKFHHGEATSLSNLGLIYGSLNDIDRFLENYNMSINILKRLNNVKQLATLNYVTGNYLKSIGDILLANKYLLKSLEYKEIVRAISGDQQKKSLLEKEIGIYYGIQRNCQLLSDYEGCILIGERAKAKWMEEMLGLDGFDFNIKSMLDLNKILDEDESILMFYNHLYSKTFTILITKDTIQIERLNNFALIDSLLVNNSFMNYCKNTFDGKKYSLIDKWNGGKSGLDFYLAKILFRTFITYYRELLQNPSPDITGMELCNKTSKEIYQFLIRPFERNLEKINEIKIIPDGYLGYLPFETLINSKDKYLVEDFNINYIQSLGVWKYLREKKHYKNKIDIAVLGFEDFSNSIIDSTDKYNWSDLNNLNSDIEAIKIIFNSNANLSDKIDSKVKITEASKNGSFEKYSILHISTHSLFVPNKPDMTSLVIPNKENSIIEYLSFHDICKMNIKTNLVTLSACETGIGDDYTGEGISGLSQAFIIAGSNGVLSTMWKVSDDNSAMFIKEYYETTIEYNNEYAISLNILKRKMISGELGELFKTPYYWSGYIYFGK